MLRVELLSRHCNAQQRYASSPGLYAVTLEPGCTQFEGDCEIVQHIDNSIYKKCITCDYLSVT